jgi:tetratricopeptide (TPR) repeat protein
MIRYLINPIHLMVVLLINIMWISYSEVVAQKMDKAKSFYDKGRQAYLRFTVKDYEDAVRYYEKALNADPDFTLAYAGLAETYALWGYELEKNQRNPDELFNKAISYGKMAVLKDSNSDVTHRALAQAYMNADEKKYGEQAYQELLTALSLDTTNAETFYLLWLHTQNDNPESPFIQKSLSLNPDFFLSHYALGVVWAKKKNFEKAVELYKQCVRINPGHFLPYFGLGNAYSQLKKYELAIPEYEKAIDINPDDTECYLYVGLACYYKEKDKQAVKYLEKYLKMNPASTHKTTVENILKDIKK